LKTKLLNHDLDDKSDKSKKERKEVIASAANGFSVLASILEKEIQEVQTNRDRDDYTSPNYTGLQADAAGQLKAYRKIQSLIKL
jgi:hypothetical protein